MTETQRHREAFEQYYLLGDKRSYPKVASKFSVSRTSVKKWAKAFDWQERVLIRDKEIGDKVEKKVVSSSIEKKAKMLNDLIRMETITEGAIRTAFVRNADGSLQKDQRGSPILNVEVEKVKDLKDLGELNIKIKQLILAVMGEPERSELAVTVTIKGAKKEELPDEN